MCRDGIALAIIIPLKINSEGGTQWRAEIFSNNPRSALRSYWFNARLLNFESQAGVWYFIKCKIRDHKASEYRVSCATEFNEFFFLTFNTALWNAKKMEPFDTAGKPAFKIIVHNVL